MAKGRAGGGGSVLAALGAFALSGVAMQAQAQTTVQTAPQSPYTSPPEGTQLEEVVVNARQRTETVQTTPVAVTAISPAVLQNAAAPTIQDLAGRAPNLVLDPVNAGPSAAAIAIRGISFEDIEKSFDPAVGVIIDGVYIGTNTGQLTDAFDVSSIEVLRGPQGTLFGRNTTGGVISLRRTKPTGVWGLNIDTIQGDYGRNDYHAVLNLPEIANVSTKLFYTRRISDGYVHNVTLDRDDTNKSDVERYGATFLWKPTPALDALFTIEKARERSRPDQGSLSTSADLVCSGVPVPIPPTGDLLIPGNTPPFTAPANECNRNTKDDLYTTFTNVLQRAVNDEVDLTGEINYRIGGITLTSVTGYRNSHEDTVQDFDATSIHFYETDRPERYHQVSEEARAAGNVTSTIDFVAGVYYFDSGYVNNQTTNLGPAFIPLAIDVPAALLGPNPPGVQTFQHVTHHSQSVAIFGDVNWQFLPKWRITVGGRQTWDDKDVDNESVGVFHVKAKASWDQFTPKVSLDYRPNSNILAYFSYSEGYRAGGFNGRGATAVSASTPYNPETVTSYEIGLKSEWFDKRFKANVALFDSSYDNKQEEVVVPVLNPAPGQLPDDTLVVNAATATIRGAEFDTEALLSRNFTIRGTLGILDASYDKFQRLDVTYSNTTATTPVFVYDDLTNMHLRRTPPVTGGVGFDWRMPVSYGLWTLSGDYRYSAPYQTSIVTAPGTGTYTGSCVPGSGNVTGCTYVQPVNDPRGRAQSRNTVDLNLAYERPMPTGALRIAVFVRNLTDDRGLAAALPVAGLFTFGTGRAPRTFGVQLGYKF